MDDLKTRVRNAEAYVRQTIVAEGLRPLHIECVGSAYIEDKRTSDIDILVLAKGNNVESMSFGCGWEYGGSTGEDGEDQWGSWKRTVAHVGEVNMLITTDEKYFDAWLTSAEVCRLLYLHGINISKAARVGIHSIIMDNSSADYEHSRKLSY